MPHGRLAHCISNAGLAGRTELRSIVVDGRVYHAADGTPTRMAGVVADVTDRRRIEEALQQTQRLQADGHNRRRRRP